MKQRKDVKSSVWSDQPFESKLKKNDEMKKDLAFGRLMRYPGFGLEKQTTETEMKKGDRGKFLHPFTFGTMEYGTVLSVLSNGLVKVRFDRPASKGRFVFVVLAD